MPFGVIWRTAETAAGEKVAFVANLNKQPVSIKIPRRGIFSRWRDLLGDKKIGDVVELKSLEILLLK